MIMGCSEITGSMKVKFYVEFLCLGGAKYCAQNLGQKLNMVAMLKYAQKSSPKTENRFSRNLVCSI